MLKGFKGWGLVKCLVIVVSTSAALTAIAIGVVTLMEKLAPCNTTVQISEAQDSDYPCIEFLVQSSCAQLLTAVLGTVIEVEAVAWDPPIENLSNVSVSETYDVEVNIQEVTTLGWTFTRQIRQQVQAGEHDRFLVRLLPKEDEGIELLSGSESNGFAVIIHLDVQNASEKSVGSGEVRLVFKRGFRSFSAARIVEL